MTTTRSTSTETVTRTAPRWMDPEEASSDPRYQPKVVTTTKVVGTVAAVEVGPHRQRVVTMDDGTVCVHFGAFFTNEADSGWSGHDVQQTVGHIVRITSVKEDSAGRLEIQTLDVVN